VTPEELRDLATKVAEALEDPATWCDGVEARDTRGQYVHYYSPRAVRWCAYGHARRLGGLEAAHVLALTYFGRFRVGLTLDNDNRGREYTRDRLLELANS
jgi:hypothetical protein